MTIEATGSRLTAALTSHLAPRRAAEGVGLALRRLAQQGIEAVAPRVPEARRLPACRHLPEAVAAALTLDSSLAALIAEIEDQLAWQQNANYSDAAMNHDGWTITPMPSWSAGRPVARRRLPHGVAGAWTAFALSRP